MWTKEQTMETESDFKLKACHGNRGKTQLGLMTHTHTPHTHIQTQDREEAKLNTLNTKCGTIKIKKREPEIKDRNKDQTLEPGKSRHKTYVDMTESCKGHGRKKMKMNFCELSQKFCKIPSQFCEISQDLRGSIENTMRTMKKYTKPRKTKTLGPRPRTITNQCDDKTEF